MDLLQPRSRDPVNVSCRNQYSTRAIETPLILPVSSRSPSIELFTCHSPFVQGVETGCTLGLHHDWCLSSHRFPVTLHLLFSQNNSDVSFSFTLSGSCD